jgi:bacterioferritin-associated ferredoxin
MYVCICHAVTERQIHAEIGRGAVTVQQLRDRLQVTNCCGSCTGPVADCLDRVTANELDVRGMLPGAVIP